MAPLPLPPRASHLRAPAEPTTCSHTYRILTMCVCPSLWLLMPLPLAPRNHAALADGGGASGARLARRLHRRLEPKLDRLPHARRARGGAAHPPWGARARAAARHDRRPPRAPLARLLPQSDGILPKDVCVLLAGEPAHHHCDASAGVHGGLADARSRDRARSRAVARRRRRQQDAPRIRRARSALNGLIYLK